MVINTKRMISEVRLPQAMRKKNVELVGRRPVRTKGEVVSPIMELKRGGEKNRVDQDPLKSSSMGGVK